MNDKPRKYQNHLDDQHDWYRSQPPSYRRLWWEWAQKQDNFMDMVQAFKEDDPSVVHMRDLCLHKYKAGTK